jgi:hypothetical protein
MNTAGETPTPTTEPVAGPSPPRLLDQLRVAAQAAGHSEQTVAAYAAWNCRYILFHGKRHPRDLSLPHISQFLHQVVTTEKEPLPALDRARAALDFLYGSVLHIVVGELPCPQPPRLLDQVRQVLRVRHYALRTEECYLQWIIRYIWFHNKRHPREMGAAEVEQFLAHLAVEGRVSASTQNQALAALLFLYGQGGDGAPGARRKWLCRSRRRVHGCSRDRCQDDDSKEP